MFTKHIDGMHDLSYTERLKALQIRAVTIHSCHDPIRFDSVRSRFDPIHYPFVQTNTTKISNSECHLNDLLNKITMNKVHKIHHNTPASNCNNIILFVMLHTNQFVAIFWQQCR